MIGPGKYDGVCTRAREQAEALGAIIIIFKGKHGNGFSCQLPASAIPAIPDILRQVAKQIEDGEAL